MLENDERLFNEFKRVDMICGDMFSCQHGISRYIEEMDRTPSYRRSRVPAWNEVYRNLKRVRWLRNQIVHEMSAVDCSVNDVEWLEDFHDRILRQQDPLAILRKIEQERPKNTRVSGSAQECSPDLRIESERKTETFGKAAGSFGGIAAAVLAAVLVIFFFWQIGGFM